MLPTESVALARLYENGSVVGTGVARCRFSVGRCILPWCSEAVRLSLKGSEPFGMNYMQHVTDPSDLTVSTAQTRANAVSSLGTEVKAAETLTRSSRKEISALVTL